MKDSPVWFKAKLFGWGWTPVTWQGWALTFLYAFGIVGYFSDADYAFRSIPETLMEFGIPFCIITFLFLFLCYTKGEKPRWRWGK